MQARVDWRLINGLACVIVTSPDVPAARRFLVEKLGLSTEDQGDEFSQVSSGEGTPWALLQAHAGHAPQEIELYLGVDDVDQAFAAWQGRGVEMVTQPHDEDFGRTLHAWKRP